jgi:hypothetical protein
VSRTSHPSALTNDLREDAIAVRDEGVQRRQDLFVALLGETLGGDDSRPSSFQRVDLSSIGEVSAGD